MPDNKEGFGRGFNAVGESRDDGIAGGSGQEAAG